MIAVTDTESKQASYQKYLAAPDKQDKAAMKLKEVEKAQEDQEAAKRVLDEVTTVFLAEFENFKNNKTNEIKALLVKMCELDIDFHVWETILTKYGTTASRSAQPKYSSTE